uniref:Uncharacterized protein n=1 Tax=Panagrolaimus sp. JU765 TaxID=591449 RepID=A0AC34R8C4_9BILA
MELTYVEKEMIKTEAITTIKELFEIPYIRAEMRELLLEIAPSIIKKTILGSLKAQISINDDNWLYAIDNCPQGGVLFPFDDKMETTQEDDISNIQQETELIGSTIPTTITTRIEPEDVHMEDAPPRTY